MRQKRLDFHEPSGKLIFREYLVMVVPPEKIVRDIRSFKHRYLRMFGDAARVHSRPHFTVLSFLHDLSLGAVLRRELNAVGETIKKFPLAITGFNGFPHNRLLFIDAEAPNNSFSDLQNELLTVVRKKIGVQPKYAPKPGKKAHMTIALSRNQEEFESALSYFRTMDYRKDFEVDRLTVISRNFCEEVDGKRLNLRQVSKWEKNFEIELLG